MDEEKRAGGGGGSIALSSTATMADPRVRCGVLDVKTGLGGMLMQLRQPDERIEILIRRERYLQYSVPGPRKQSTCERVGTLRAPIPESET